MNGIISNFLGRRGRKKTFRHKNKSWKKFSPCCHQSWTILLECSSHNKHNGLKMHHSWYPNGQPLHKDCIMELYLLFHSYMEPYPRLQGTELTYSTSQSYQTAKMNNRTCIRKPKMKAKLQFKEQSTSTRKTSKLILDVHLKSF